MQQGGTIKILNEQSLGIFFGKDRICRGGVERPLAKDTRKFHSQTPEALREIYIAGFGMISPEAKSNRSPALA